MAESEQDLADAQRRHWQDTYSAHPGMYGEQPSAPALHAARAFRAARAKDVLELGERRRNLQTQLKDLLLALKTDVLGPLDHAGDIALGLDVLANTEVTGALLEERVLQKSVAA